MVCQVVAYPSFCSMKRLGVFLQPPRWDVSPSQCSPPVLNSPALIEAPGWREALWAWSVFPNKTTQRSRLGFALTMRLPPLTMLFTGRSLALLTALTWYSHKYLHFLYILTLLATHRAISMWVSTRNWFCCTDLEDWLRKLAPLFHPIRSKTSHQSWLAYTHFSALKVCCL